MKKRSRRQRDREEILEILDAFHRSGLSQVAFSRKRGVPVSTLQLYLRKERERGKPKSSKKSPAVSRQFVPVKIVDPPPTIAPSLLEFELPTGGKLRFSADLSPESLACYVEALRKQC